MEIYYNEKLPIRTKKFSLLLQELVSTEKSYLKDMENLEQLFRKIKKLGIISRDCTECLRIFANICELSRCLIKYLMQDVGNLSLYIEIFNQYQNNIQYVYLDYTLIYKNVVEICTNSSNNELHQMLKIFQSDIHLEVDFHSYLTKPIQRLSKYPTFFEILLTEQCINLEEFENLQLLKCNYFGIIFYINEFKKRLEGAMHWECILKNHSEIKKKCYELNIGDYIIHGDFKESGKQFTAYCFTKALVIIVRKSKNSLKLQSFLQVSSMRIGENKYSDELQFVVEDSSAKKFKRLFKFNDLSQQILWISILKTVKEIKTKDELDIYKMYHLYGNEEGRRIILLTEMISKSTKYMTKQACLVNINENAEGQKINSNIKEMSTLKSNSPIYDEISTILSEPDSKEYMNLSS